MPWTHPPEGIIDAASPSIHVVAREHDWIVRSARSSRAIAAFNTQQEAIVRARRIAADANTDVVIHGSDGRPRDCVEQRRLELGAHFHVAPRDDAWIIANTRGESTDRAFASKLDAVDVARDLARSHHGVLLIHARDGAVEQIYHYDDANQHYENYIEGNYEDEPVGS